MSQYRRLLNGLLNTDVQFIYSHQLASLAGVTAAQVRRDIMAVGYTGSPTKGYDIRRLIESIGNFLDEPHGQSVALVGVGNLGRAILSYFVGRRPRLFIVAAFDNDPHKVNRVTHGCRCYPMEELAAVVREKGITIGIITVPAAGAQEVADALVAGGVRGVLNFAPVPLHVPPGVRVEEIDMITALEKVAYFARSNAPARKAV